jgi:hypothetical protein
VKSGYGTLAEVKKMNSREVTQAIHFEKFVSDYENSYIQINRSEK